MRTKIPVGREDSKPARAAVRAEVESLRPHDSEEARHISETLAWIDSGAGLFRTAKPATPPRHLVSYFVVVDGNSVLLVDHINAELWLPTGGHVDPEEHPRDTVIREAREELELEAVFLHEGPQFLTCTETKGKTAGHVDVSLWYVLEGHREREYRFDPREFHQVRWFSREEVPLGRSDPHMGRFLDKVVRPQGGTKE